MQRTAWGLVEMRARGARHWRYPLVVIGLLSPVAQAGAQGISAQPPAVTVRDNDDAPLRATGNLPGLGGYPGRGLSLGATFAGRYESNLGRQGGDAAGFRLRPQADMRYGLALGRQGLYVEGTVGRDIILGSDVIPDRNRYSAGAGLAYQLSRCTGQLGASWQKSLAFETDALAFGGFEQERRNFGLSASCRLSAAISLEGSVIRQLVETSQRQFDPFGFNSWTYTAGLGFGSAALGRFSLSGALTNSEMPGRLVVTPDGLLEDGLRQKSLRLGYQRKFGSRISLGLGVSYIDSQPKFDESILIIGGVPQLVPREGFSGLGYDVALDFVLSPRLSIDLTATRSSFVNPVVGAQLTVANNYAAAVNYRLNERYSVAAGASFRRNDFRGGFVSELEPFLRDSDQFDRFFGQFTAKMGRRLRIALDVTHNRRRSDPQVFNFSSTGAGINLGLDFGGSR